MYFDGFIFCCGNVLLADVVCFLLTTGVTESKAEYFQNPERNVKETWLLKLCPHLCGWTRINSSVEA